MTLSQTHLPLPVSLALATLIAAGLVWYWLRLGYDEVPRSRRMIRRVSLGLMLFSLLFLVAGLSLINHKQSPRAFVVVWSVILLCVVLILLTGVIDFLNSLAVHRRQKVDAYIEAVAEAARRRREQALRAGEGEGEHEAGTE